MGDVEAWREAVWSFVFKGEPLPPATVTLGAESPVANLPNLAAVDLLTVTMGDLSTYAYRFRCADGNGDLTLYHAGHSEGLGQYGGEESISHFLERGDDVVGFWMPGFGPNTCLPDLPSRHEIFAGQETAGFTPLLYFLAPPLAVIDAFAGQYGAITMIGISGGGWTTTLCAAMEPRIRRSYPVAGTLPLWLRTPPCLSDGERGDWEQQGSALYGLVDYLDLYVMGSAGAGRSQIQILNQYDACCFSGLRYRIYEDAVREVVEGTGGAFRVVLDSTHEEHRISDWALAQVV